MDCLLIRGEENCFLIDDSIDVIELQSIPKKGELVEYNSLLYRVNEVIHRSVSPRQNAISISGSDEGFMCPVWLVVSA